MISGARVRYFETMQLGYTAPHSRKTFAAEHQGCRLTGSVHGSGIPVIFIQGTGLHGDGWLPQVNGLGAQCECLWFDNRGMGASQPNTTAITVEQMAADTLALMDARGWDSAHVVGHSLGGLVALHLALSARTRVRSLSLLGTFSRGRDATLLTWRMFWLGLRTYIGTRAMRRRAFVEIVLPGHLLAETNGDAWAAGLAPLFGHDLADHPPVVMQQLAAMNACDLTPRLGELEGMPVLVVGAQHDLIARPEVVKALATGIPGSRLIMLPDAAHGVTIQCAAEINALLLDHFSAVEKKRV